MGIECPTCGGEVVYDELIDDDFDGSSCNATWSGRCTCCGSKVVWTEVYTFSYVERVEVEEE